MYVCDLRGLGARSEPSQVLSSLPSLYALIYFSVSPASSTPLRFCFFCFFLFLFLFLLLLLLFISGYPQCQYRVQFKFYCFTSPSMEEQVGHRGSQHWAEPVAPAETLARLEKFEKFEWRPPNYKLRSLKCLRFAGTTVEAVSLRIARLPS